MNAPILFALAMSAAPPAPPPRLELAPGIVQSAMLVLADDVRAGGAGGGVALQLRYDRRYLAQADTLLLFGAGRTVVTRLALGAEHRLAGSWTPAAWLTVGALWGDRVEILRPDASRPPTPFWSTGVRASLLRFGTDRGAISLLEPGIATDLRGGIWFDATLVQASVRF